MPADRYVVQCNYVSPTNVAAYGARAYLVRLNPGGGDNRIIILVRSRGGRWIEKWENIRRLSAFRVKTLPPQHPLYTDERLDDADPHIAAERLNEAHWRLVPPPSLPEGGDH